MSDFPLFPYQCQGYTKDMIKGLYIGYVGDNLCYFEVNDKNQTIKSGSINDCGDEWESKITFAHIKKAGMLKGMAFNQVQIF